MVKGTKQEILRRIGASLRAWRLRENLTQQVLAERSGVSLNAIRHIESGEGATLGSFVQACRILGRDRWIEDLEPRNELTPLAIAEALNRQSPAKPRQRASKRRTASGTLRQPTI